MLPLLTAESATIHIEGLDSLGEAAHSNAAFMGELIGLTAVILIFGTPVIIVMAVLMHRSRRIRMQNEVILKLADKGVPIPPEMFMDPQQRGNSDLRSGLSMIGIGLGLAFGFYMAGGVEGAGFALIPFFIGAARLIAWKYDRKESQS
jgi:glycerol uptake facilitator-like aquaporin